MKELKPDQQKLIQTLNSKFSSVSISNSAWLRVVVFSQSILVSFSICFYFLTKFHQVSFSQSFSKNLEDSPRRLAFIITIISTTLSSFSSFLFSRAIVVWLSIRIQKPTPLYYLSGIIELSRGKWMLRTTYPSLSIVTILVGIFLKSLTTSWATLLTPTHITITTPIEGLEIDLGSPELSGLLNRSDTYPSMIAALRSNNPTTFGSLLASSGIASAYSKLGIPRLFEFDNALFNSSTGGVLPIGAMSIDPGANSEMIQQNLIGGPLTAALDSSQNQSKLASSGIGKDQVENRLITGSHTIFQQGFSISAKCDLAQNLSNLLIARPETINFRTSNETKLNTTMTKWSFDAHCPNGAKLSLPDVVTAVDAGIKGGGGLVTVTVCKDQDLKGVASAGNHLLILMGNGIGYGYLSPTICSVSPRLTTLEVQYTDSISISKILSTTFLPPSSETLKDQFLDIIQAGISGSQNIYTNTFGDGIRSIYRTLRPDEDLNGSSKNQGLLNEIMENYFQGQVEFVGSYLKSSLKNSDQLQEDSMTKLYAGEWHPVRMGWDQGKISSTIALIPIFLISAISILASVKSERVNSNSKNRVQRSDGKGSEFFRPDDLIQLMDSARIGNLTDWVNGSVVHDNNDFKSYNDLDQSQKSSAGIEGALVDGSKEELDLENDTEINGSNKSSPKPGQSKMRRSNNHLSLRTVNSLSPRSDNDHRNQSQTFLNQIENLKFKIEKIHNKETVLIDRSNSSLTKTNEKNYKLVGDVGNSPDHDDIGTSKPVTTSDEEHAKKERKTVIREKWRLQFCE